MNQSCKPSFRFQRLNFGCVTWSLLVWYVFFFPFLRIISSLTRALVHFSCLGWWWWWCQVEVQHARTYQWYNNTVYMLTYDIFIYVSSVSSSLLLYLSVIQTWGAHTLRQPWNSTVCPSKQGQSPVWKYSANHHFSGANCAFSGVYHSKKWSVPGNQPWLLQLVLRHHVVPHLAVAWFWLRLIWMDMRVDTIGKEVKSFKLTMYTHIVIYLYPC